MCSWCESVSVSVPVSVRVLVCLCRVCVGVVGAVGVWVG